MKPVIVYAMKDASAQSGTLNDLPLFFSPNRKSSGLIQSVIE